MSPIVCENCANYVESKKYCLFFSEFIAGINNCYVDDKDFVKVGGGKNGKTCKC